MKKRTIKEFISVASIIAVLSACSSVSEPKPISGTLTGNWFVDAIAETKTLENTKVKLTFDAENRLSGSASCNNISSSYIQKDNTLTISPIAATRKMCSETLMTQESSLLQALNQVKRFQLTNDELSLFDQKGTILVKAYRTD